MVWAWQNRTVSAVNVTDRYTQEPMTLAEGQVEIMLRVVDRAGQRLAVEMEVLNGANDVVFKGQSKDELFDTNDHCMVVLQEHELTLVRSAVTLTVSGELDEPEPDDLEDEEGDDDDSETYELLVSFVADNQDYGLYIPLDPFFVVARMEESGAVLVEGEDFDRIQPRIEAELEEREPAE